MYHPDDLLDEWPPKSPFIHRGSLHWGELAPIIRRNANLHAAIRLNFYPRLFKDFVTIMDWHLPEMAMRTGAWKPHMGETRGQASTVEYEAHAVVTNIAWLGGECPMEDVKGVFMKDQWGRDTTRMIRRPLLGVKSAINRALYMKTLLPSLELGLLLGNWDMVVKNRSRRGVL